MTCLDGGAKSVLQKLGQDVFEVIGHVGERCGWLIFDQNGGPYAVFQLADLTHGCFAVADYVCWAEGCVYHAYVTAVAARGWRVCDAVGLVNAGRRGMRLAGEVEGNMLFGDQACTDSCAKMFVEESGHFSAGYVFPAFEKPSGEYRDGVGVGLDQVGHDLRE